MTDATNSEKNGIDKTGRLREGFNDAKSKASDMLHHSRDSAQRTVHGLESSPLGILVGGLAVGVLAGTLLPRSAREKAFLAPLGRRIGDTVREATAAAKEAGQGELQNLGLTKDAARGQARSLLDGVVKAISTAGSAAAKTAAHKPQG